MSFGYNDIGADVEASTVGGGRVTIAPGDYNVMITTASYGASKSGSGHNVEMTYSVIDGEFAGVDIKEWLAVVNKSDDAQRIAQGKIKALFVITGKTKARATEEMVGSTIRVRVQHTPNVWTDKTGNRREGVNAEVVAYMTTAGKLADGTDAPPFVARPVVAKAQTGGAKASTGTNQFGGTSGSVSDDEIPF